MKICRNSKCGLRNLFMIDANFCTSCGSKLENAQGKGICGHDVTYNSKFCGECGIDLLSKPEDIEDSYREIEEENVRATRSNAVEDSGFMGVID